jgi:hypothetical protein
MDRSRWSTQPTAKVNEGRKIVRDEEVVGHAVMHDVLKSWAAAAS